MSLDVQEIIKSYDMSEVKRASPGLVCQVLARRDLLNSAMLTKSAGTLNSRV